MKYFEQSQKVGWFIGLMALIFILALGYLVKSYYTPGPEIQMEEEEIIITPSGYLPEPRLR